MPALPAPLVIAAKSGNAIRLAHLDERAEALGLETGTGLADARAAFPFLDIAEEDTGADSLLLGAIADWADRYTPLVALDAADTGGFGLMLDITGCAHLFGGERALMSDLLARLFHQGFAATAAIAPAPGAAWALARFRSRPAQHAGHDVSRSEDLAILTQHEALETALAPLPVAALRLPSETVSGLAQIGLRTVGQVRLRPRAPLARRFGRAVLHRLDQALGAIGESISPRRALPELTAERRFAEPLVLEEDLLAVTQRLAGHVCDDMEKRGKGARRLELALFRVDGKVERLVAGTGSALRDPARIATLFRERFAALHEDHDPGFGFETIRLAVTASDTLEAAQTEFGNSGGPDDAGHLIDRLAARLGAANVTCSTIADSHLPEAAERVLRHAPHKSAPSFRQQQSLSRDTNIPASPLTRPLRILADPEPVEAVAEVPEGPPVRFRWRRVLHRVVRAEGPERIADTWWGKPTPRRTRDYYRIEDEAGHRYWLFREGLYGREPGEPRWFMHGLFA